MRLSVVIPSYNSGPGLRMLLRSLEQQQLGAKHQFEVVLVDDGSDDGTAEAVKEFELTYIRKPRNEGRSAARNTGIAAATGDVVVMVDADVVVPQNFLAEHVRYHERNDALVVIGPRLNLDHDSDEISGTGHDVREPLFNALGHNLNSLATCWHFLYSCNASVGRAHLDKVGGFDEGFAGWGLEDSELGYRLRQDGLAFAFNPQAVVYHQHQQVHPNEVRDSWRRNLRYFADKHDAPEVKLQWILDIAYNQSPATFKESVLRFEYGARAFTGRQPGTTTYDLIEIHPGQEHEKLDRIRESGNDLLIIDHSADPEITATVQCLGTDRHLAYFIRPDEPDRIIAAHSGAGR